jgi:DNA-binding response OmpR family regulator
VPELRDLLVVEDEPVVRDAALRILRPESLTIDQETDVPGARKRLADADYRVILSDLKLPGPPGFELIADAAEARAATQVIMITGYATVENALRSFQLGAFDFVPKPFDLYELQGVVRRALAYRERLLSGDLVSRPSADGERKRYSLGHHSWVSLDRDGSATCGPGASVAGLIEDPKTLELPTLEQHVGQGDRLARLVSAEELVHRVWAPLSGRIIAVNERVSESVNLIDRDPFGSGWLVRLIPEKLEEELGLLSRD